eukprot:gene4225-biopygen5249
MQTINIRLGVRGIRRRGHRDMNRVTVLYSDAFAILRGRGTGPSRGKASGTPPRRGAPRQNLRAWYNRTTPSVASAAQISAHSSSSTRVFGRNFAPRWTGFSVSSTSPIRRQSEAVAISLHACAPAEENTSIAASSPALHRCT